MRASSAVTSCDARYLDARYLDVMSSMPKRPHSTDRRAVRLLAAAGAVTLLITSACAGSDPDSIDSNVSASIAVDAGGPDAGSSTEPALSPSGTDATASDTTTTTTTTATSTTTTATSTTSTTSTSTTSTTSTTVAPEPSFETITAHLDAGVDTFAIGTSVEGRPIVAERVSPLGGRKVLIIGVIHGNEDAGIQIVDELRTRAADGGVDDSVELWLIEASNPDGVVHQIRHNANGVDLNRNFPYQWGPIGELGHNQYAGTGPASEPETQATVDFISQLRPDIAIWYHQDANLIIPSTGRDGRIRARYAELTALPIADCCSGGIYTGIAATWARNELKQDSDAVAFIVELPGGVLSETQVDTHTDAVLTIAVEG